jgi:hypothetical protein
VGRDGSVGIATGYGLDGLGVESRWGRDFPHLLRSALGPTQSQIKWLPGISLGQIVRGMALTTHHLPVPRLKKEQSYTSTPLWVFIADYKVNLTYWRIISDKTYTALNTHSASPSGLKRGNATALLLGMSVRIPPGYGYLGHSMSSEPNFQHSDPRMKFSICEAKIMNSFGDLFSKF